MEKIKNDNDSMNYEERVKEIRLGLFAEALNFGRIDNGINSALKDMLEIVSDYLKNNPNALVSGNSDVQKLICKLNAKEGKADIQGGDIAGADVSLQDIADFINSIAGFIKDEKKFWWNVILLIVCGCDKV